MEISCSKYMYCKRAFSTGVLGWKRMLCLKTGKVTPPKAIKLCPPSQMMPCPQLHCWQGEWDGKQESNAASRNESLHWRTWLWQSCQSNQTQDDHRLILKCCQMPRMWVRVIWQEGRLAVGRKEGRCANKRREKLYLTSRLCHLIERQYSLIYQKLSFNKSKAFIQIN